MPPTTAGFRIKDEVTITGTPHLEAPPYLVSTPSPGSKLTLFVASEADLKFVNAPMQITLWRIVGALAIGTLLLGVGVAWNWMLRRQVAHRTARLNEVSIHLRQAYEAIRNAILVTDQNDCVSGVNHQFGDMFGFLPSVGSQAETALLAMASQFEDATSFEDMILSTGRTQELPLAAQLTMTKSNRTIDLFSSIIADPNGSSFGRLWSFEDITEKLKIEEDLIQSQKMEAVGQLSGGIAHDFNNLLTVIRSSLIMIGRSVAANKPYDNFRNAADMAIDRAAELTQHLLGFFRLSMFSTCVIAANQVVNQSYALVRRLVDSTVIIRMELIPQAANVLADSTRLEQVVTNMCINARDSFSDKTGVIVIKTAICTHKAIEALTCDSSYDAVLLDLTMPEMSGAETYGEIQRQWPTVPVALCTGYSIDMPKLLGSEVAKPPPIIAKPYRMSDLEEQLCLLRHSAIEAGSDRNGIDRFASKPERIKTGRRSSQVTPVSTIE